MSFLVGSCPLRLTRFCRENNKEVAAHEAEISDVLESFAQQQRYQVHKPKFALPAQPVDIVFGSPPCCSHSKANRKKLLDNPRSFLIFAFLSAVELFCPSYLCVVPTSRACSLGADPCSGINSVLENVVDMIFAKLPSLDGEAEVDKGLTKLFVEIADSLGSVLLASGRLSVADASRRYQVSFGILQAEAFLTPQSRRRLFVVGTKIRLPSLALPQPWSVHKTRRSTVSHPSDDGGSDVKSCVSTSQDNTSPHLAPAFDQVTSDLPKFEIADPTPGAVPRPYPAFRHDTVNEVIHDFDLKVATSTFQKAIRWNERADLRPAGSPLTSHSVNRFIRPLVVQRLCAIPPEGGDERGEVIPLLLSSPTNAFDPCRPPIPPSTGRQVVGTLLAFPFFLTEALTNLRSFRRTAASR